LKGVIEKDMPLIEEWGFVAFAGRKVENRLQLPISNRLSTLDYINLNSIARADFIGIIFL
jgi:hypothetical protein